MAKWRNRVWRKGFLPGEDELDIDEDETVRMVGYHRGRRPLRDELPTPPAPDVILDPVPE